MFLVFCFVCFLFFCWLVLSYSFFYAVCLLSFIIWLMSVVYCWAEYNVDVIVVIVYSMYVFTYFIFNPSLRHVFVPYFSLLFVGLITYSIWIYVYCCVYVDSCIVVRFVLCEWCCVYSSCSCVCCCLFYILLFFYYMTTVWVLDVSTRFHYDCFVFLW